MNKTSQILGLKSFEKLLLQKGFVICQQTGQKITQVEDLVAVHLACGVDQFVILPVHKENANTFLQTMLTTFSGVLSLKEEEPFEYRWRE